MGLDRRVAALDAYLPDLPRHRRGTEEDVFALVNRIGSPLPDDYRKFLLLYGGIAPARGSWTVRPDDPAWDEHLVEIVGFLGFGVAGNPWVQRSYVHDLPSSLETWASRVGAEFLPIATLDGGDPLILSVRGPFCGQVWLFAHDHPNNDAVRADGDEDGPWWECMYRCSSSFAALIEGITLEVDADEPMIEPLEGEPGYDSIRRRSERIEQRRQAETAPQREAVQRIEELLAGFDLFPRPNDNAASLFSDLNHLVRYKRDSLTEIRNGRIKHRLGYIGGPGRSKQEIEAMFHRLLETVQGLIAPSTSYPARPTTRAIAVADQPRRVRHAVFGEGHIVRALESDKHVVRFDDGTERTLQGRFLSPIGDPES